MTQRRRLSRAQVERDPRREVRPGVSAATWWGVDTLATPIRTERIEVPFTMETLEAAIAKLSAPRQAITSRDAMLAWYRERAERRALATTGRVLVAWLIGRWRR